MHLLMRGLVSHRRHRPQPHHLKYALYALQVDLDRLDQLTPWSMVSMHSLAPIRFKPSDYLTADLATEDGADLKRRALNKAAQLGANIAPIDQVLFVGQGRCFGFYFSPVNFYLLNHEGNTTHVLAEVSNTPWGEHHYYLVDANTPKTHEKAFHVSPFLDMGMDYQWRFKTSNDRLVVHIDNIDDEGKIFDATLSLRGQAWSKQNQRAILYKHPLMTFKIVLGIYIHAFKLWRKGIPLYPHPKSQKSSPEK